jgi:hypothetical protein
MTQNFQKSCKKVDRKILISDARDEQVSQQKGPADLRQALSNDSRTMCGITDWCCVIHLWWISTLGPTGCTQGCA